jgi:acetyl esterase/lipase
VTNQEPFSVLLWKNGAPGAFGDEDADKPQITAYLAEPDKANGASVILCPGGGYHHLSNGASVAEWFRSFGVATFVLRYRIAPKYHHPAPLLDAQRAIRTVRARSREWGLDPKRIGIMGFSAGGHLAASAGTMFDDGRADANDPIDRQSSRPDFLVLGYAVITMRLPYVDMESSIFLLGDSPSPELMDLTSPELHVTAKTPPAFIMQTNADDDVSAENSAMFYLALRKAGVPAEMHIYATGPHGIGMAQGDPFNGNWPDRLRLWMGVRKLLG